MNKCWHVREPGPFLRVSEAPNEHGRIMLEHLESSYVLMALPEEILSEEPRLPRARPNWPRVWMNVARDISQRSHDDRLQVGAIIVPEDNTGILALGYNGLWVGGPNVVASREPGKSDTIHAEANALVKCPYHYPLKKHMYVTDSPCRECSKLIVNARISRVVYDRPYRDESGLEIMRSAGIEVYQLDEAITRA